MNPDNVIRPWLLGCGQAFGAQEAHLYRWADAKSRPEVPHFTYRPVRGAPDIRYGAVAKDTAVDTYDCQSEYQQHWTVTYQIDLYNSSTGFADLAGCCIGAGHEQAYKNIFQQNNAAFHGASEVTDLTETDGERAYYHHRVLCTFHTWFVYQHKNINHVVTDVVLDNPFGTD